MPFVPFIGWIIQHPKEMTAEQPTTEIGHDEFDPTGTLALILVYFAILVGLWIFMYFVEFLGNELTVMG